LLLRAAWGQSSTWRKRSRGHWCWIGASLRIVALIHSWNKSTSTSEIRTVWISNGHKTDGFLVRFSNGSHLVFSIRNTDQTFLTASLDRFDNFLLLIKRSRLVDHSKTGLRVRFSNG
jgi:hypothetical protein